ncbi:MAG: hypothetical protein OEM89_10185 [Nitrosopumilus sp.]|nr:hypothetical protein [Nitrosopumilus sp.]
MKNETSDLIDTLYEKESVPIKDIKINPMVRKSPQAKYQIFDEEEFTHGREVLGNLIVRGMVTSGGTDIDWLIEHNGSFVILEFKGFHNDKINIPMGQMIAYEKLHEKLNQSTKCYLYFIGCDDIDFSNPDSKIWFFEMKQWKFGGIPKNTRDAYDPKVKLNKFIIYREYMEEISVEQLRKIIDSHWKDFE